MRKIKQLLSVAILLMVYITGFSQGYHVRIGFIGNSITIGTGLPNAGVQCYPSQLRDSFLNVKYGDTCIVGNFAVSGRTMLKKGDYPIWNEQFFKDALQFAPNILFIMLGTNDSKSYNWDDHKGDYFGDYMSMIDTFKKRNPDTKFVLCLPPKAFSGMYDIRDSVIINGIIPLIDSVAKVTGADTVNFHLQLSGDSILFPDGIHPNIQGSHIMAAIDYEKLLSTDLIHKVDTGLTFVTNFKTSNSVVRDIDSVSLSWTTVNADSTFLNGEKVDVNGSKYVKAKTTTIYTLLAMGKINNDSLQLTQTFYHPVLTKISISPSKKIIHVNDSVNYFAKFIDQYNKFITDTTYTLDWSVATGAGTMIHKTSTSATYITDVTGAASIIAQVGSIISNTATITINPPVNISGKQYSGEKVSVFPNPVRDIINVTISTSGPTTVSIKIYDLKGILQVENYQYLSSQGDHTVKLITKNLASGIYLYQVECSGKQFNGKINIVKK